MEPAANVAHEELPYDLSRFVAAQADMFDDALAELQTGRKRGHWMWFIFPQLRGLGVSATAQHFGLAGIGEARAYLGHPLLGPRLVASVEALLGLRGPTLSQIFGSPDDLKFASSMTLFALASDRQNDPFRRALALYCGGQMDARTEKMLAGSARSV
ncbi:MAG TPA: DUF1810 domain-containing protein [Bosea sp. (in: a-proteobacteria)]|jgi:uncharacterized protein (DUF1810 family)|uniref:DUF1810 domain-containing protein n=1 Tax=Bosea sp. (in: a-proteobacteria) TaxID=1871050 RepID=UPI002E1271CE|nr:DUF1810 domain-containing protein [Bosea sp. (in: a-proteobacteria)]